MRSRALCRMQNITVETTKADDIVNTSLKSALDQELGVLRQHTPQAVLHKKVDISAFHGLQLWQVTRIRNKPALLFGGETATALADLDAHELWRIPLGLTNVCMAELDGPAQPRIMGISKDQLVILDAISGRQLRQARLPEADPFRQFHGDVIAPGFGGITPARLKPKDQTMGLILRQEAGGGSRRYYAYDNQLKPLWETYIPRPPGAHVIQVTNLCSHDADEICTGMHILDHTGRLVWSAPDASIFATHGGDHIDWVVMSKLGRDDRVFLAMATGHEGLFVYDRQGGKRLFSHQFGHVQSVFADAFVPGRTDLQLWATTRWDNYGISCVVASDGTILSRMQLDFTSDVAKPVNWSGDGIKLVFPCAGIQASYDRFGLVNWQDRLVVPFNATEIGWKNPREPVPVYVADVTGDPRDEVLIRNNDCLWIYTQGKTG